jgi:UDP-N-acetyl-D-glucosamine dehydrogenase
LVMGLAYKANIDDDRESPSYELLELLQDAGARIAYCDPHFPTARKVRKHDLGLTSVPCAPQTLAEYDAVVISTAHDAFRDAHLFHSARLVVDTRNLVAPLFSGRPLPFRLVKA